MKPSEIIPIERTRINGHSKAIKCLNYYFNEDCVVSYAKNSLSLIFLIKGKIKPFAFAYIDTKITPYYYNICLIPLKDYFELFETIKNQEVSQLVDETKFKQVKAKMILKEIRI